MTKRIENKIQSWANHAGPDFSEVTLQGADFSEVNLYGADFMRWWAAALLVAAPILVAELQSAGWGISVSLAFTVAGSLLGLTMRRILSGGRVQ